MEIIPRLTAISKNSEGLAFQTFLDELADEPIPPARLAVLQAVRIRDPANSIANFAARRRDLVVVLHAKLVGCVHAGGPRLRTLRNRKRVRSSIDQPRTRKNYVR